MGPFESFSVGLATMYHGGCVEWLAEAPRESVSAVVTDPPYGLVEYSDAERARMRDGQGGGVWRMPPSIGGHKRSPVPRFTVLSGSQKEDLYRFFLTWGQVLLPVLVPGAHVFIASSPLLSHIVSRSLDDAGFERRGEVIRLVQTLRGGDRPKNHESEYPDVTVMPRSQWEPWLLYRKPLDGTVAETLAKHGTGGLRRIDDGHPFGDVIKSSPTGKAERSLAPHPSLKPQAFLRRIVMASLPLGEGVILDTFAGSGSTLAAANHVGYRSVGVEIDDGYFELSKDAIPKLASL